MEIWQDQISTRKQALQALQVACSQHYRQGTSCKGQYRMEGQSLKSSKGKLERQSNPVEGLITKVDRERHLASQHSQLEP